MFVFYSYIRLLHLIFSSKILFGKSKHQKSTMNFKSYVADTIYSSIYSNALIIIIYVNMLLLIFESDATVSIIEQRGSQIFLFYRIMNLLFLSIYTIDTLLSIYVQGLSYFKSGYNLLDFLVVGIYWTDWISSMALTNPSLITILRIIRGLRSLKAFRLITHVIFISQILVQIS